MSNKDKQLLDSITKNVPNLLKGIFIKEKISTNSQVTLNNEELIKTIEYPLDDEIISQLTTINNNIRDTDDDFRLYTESKAIIASWKKLINKSIKCLRYFDTREPFMEIQSKSPKAYGVKELGEYFNDYAKFENLLYGGANFYRDHIIHVFRVWLLGVSMLFDKNSSYLLKIKIQEKEINVLEKISIWTIIALTHDLGYPLEKTQGILEKTKQMMKAFLYNPNIFADLSFNGVQNNMNDFVIRFMSSKMHLRNINSQLDDQGKDQKEKSYVARLQPKYYFKFQKSLEQYSHGIISSIIIYKLLTYFLESDFNINEDYTFNDEDVRQFYIRREILRAIASHTCHDIYHLDIFNFSFLLIIADDCQDWGRKCLSELYVSTGISYSLGNVDFDFPEGSINKCTINENFTLGTRNEYLIQLIKNLFNQFLLYNKIFRDGQDTKNRNFELYKKCTITTSNDSKDIMLVLEYELKQDSSSICKINIDEPTVVGTITQELENAEIKYNYDSSKKEIFLEKFKNEEFYS